MLRHRFLHVLLFPAMVISSACYSQRGMSILGGISYHDPSYDYTFQQHGLVLQRGNIIVNQKGRSEAGLAFTAALHYRFSPHLAWELGYHLTEMDEVVCDTKFLRDNGVKGGTTNWTLNGILSEKGNFDFAKWYQTGSVSLYYFAAIHSKTQPYIQAGLDYNSFLSKQNYFQGSYTYLPTGEELRMSALYKPHYFSKFIEIGLAFHSHGDSGYLNKTAFFVGFRYHLAGDVLSGDYQNNKDGVTRYTDHLVASGRYGEVTIRFPLVRFPCDNFEKSSNPYSSKHRKKKIENRKPSPTNKEKQSERNRDNTRGY